MSQRLRILVVGSGGREHALAWRLSQDPEVSEVLVAPGNDGMARAHRRLAILENDTAALVDACRSEAVELVVVGPEAPLAAGLADALRAAGIRVYGPGAEAARLEASKWFAKQVMTEVGVPTARAERFDRLEAATAALAGFGPPWVLKADGLAAGKGVCVTGDRAEAEDFLAACLVKGRFAASGRSVVLEEFLAGEELSVMAVCDGREFVLLPGARDYKRAFDGDRGPNTGGMGAYAPSPFADGALEAAVGAHIVAPVLEHMARRGTAYRGTLYAGLMLGRQGPKVVEFNCRFGDPEIQVVLPLVEGSLARLLASAAAGKLEPAVVSRRRGAAVTVALVDRGYPEAVRAQGAIEGLESLKESDDLRVFHAASGWERGRWQVRGGRVAYVMARGNNCDDARGRAYQALEGFGGIGWRCRHDIAAPPGDVAVTAVHPDHSQGR